jgi:hypothetical protein
MVPTAVQIAEEAKDMAITAANRIETHEKVCAERYAQIAKHQEQSCADRAAMRGEMTKRFDAIQSLIFRGLVTIITLLGATAVFFIVEAYKRVTAQ